VIDLADISDRSIGVSIKLLEECERRCENLAGASDHQLQTTSGIATKLQSALARAINARRVLAQAGKAFFDKLTPAEKVEAIVLFFKDLPHEQRINLFERLREVLG
jgi:hypothetical protein